MVYCAKCGTKNEEDAEFCKKCGASLTGAINGALFKLDKRIEKRDKAMNDEVMGKRLWDELARLTELTPE